MTIEEMQNRKKELGYSYEKLAELSGIPLGTVQKILGGITKTPRFETRQALEAVLSGAGVYTPEKVSTDADAIAYDFSPESGMKSAVAEAAAVYSVKKPGEFTLEDYYQIPDEQRVELIDGVFFEMTAPTNPHQILIGEIYRELMNYVRQNKGKCMPLVSPVDVQLDCDDRTMVQPDVLVICDRDKMKRRVVYGAPDFIVEILSPSTRRKDMNLKMAKYSEAGVREYWMVDPDKKKVVVYNLEHEEFPVIYTFEDEVPVGIFEGKCRIDFADIYENMRFLYEEPEEQNENDSE